MIEKALRKSLSRRVTALRKRRNLSRTDFALMAGIHRTHLIDIENGEINFGIDTLDKIISAFDMTPSEFFDFTDS